MHDEETKKWVEKQSAMRRDASSGSESTSKEENLKRLTVEWLWWLELEEKAYNDVPNASTSNASRRKRAVLLRRWWGVANACLSMFIRTKKLYGHTLEPFPAMMLANLANISEEISNGNIPAFVSDAKSGGRRWRLQERQDIAYAVAYIEAVRRREIEDKSPNKTVRNIYNVSARAVQKWVERRNEILVGVPYKHLSPDQLTKKMRECGEKYSRIGRGAPAEN